MKRQATRIVLAVALLGLVVMTGLKSSDLSAFINENAQGSGIGLFILLTALNVLAFNVPAIFVLGPIAGSTYGFWLGLCYLVAGEVLGATFWFLLFRLFGDRAIQYFFKRKLLLPQEPLAPGKLLGTMLVARSLLPLQVVSLGLAIIDHLPLWKFVIVIAAVSIPIDAAYVMFGPLLSLGPMVAAPAIVAICMIAAFLWRRSKKNGGIDRLKKSFPSFEKVAA